MLKQLSLAVLLLVPVWTAPLPAAEGSISGTVRDADGNPLEGVKVTVQAVTGAEVQMAVKTNSHGKYRAVLPYFSRAFHFSLEKDGFFTLSETIELNFTRSNEVFNERQDFVLQPLPEGFESSAVVRDDDAALYEYHPANARYNRAADYLTKGRLADARDRFQAIVDEFPDYGRGFTGLAMTHLQLEDYVAASEAAERALKVYDRDLRAMQVRHQAYAALGDERAAATLDALLAVKPAPEFAALVYNEGVRLLEDEHLDAAGARFEQALRLDPGRLDARRGHIDILFQQQDYEAAIEAAEEFLQKQASDLHILQLRYEAYRALGDTRKARRARKDLDDALQPEASDSDDPFDDYNPG